MGDPLHLSRRSHRRRAIPPLWSFPYFLGKYFTLFIFLRSESWVQRMALNSCAVARMRLSAIGRACSILNFEAAIASGTVKATTVPFCIAAAACNASFSPDSRRTTLNTSYIVIIGTTSEAESFKGARKCFAFGSSAKYASQPEESTIFLTYHPRV